MPTRRSKIVATLGPASHQEDVLEQLLAAGMDVARVNLSHGTTSAHEATIATVRRAARRRGVPFAVLIDLPGPKLRLGDLDAPFTVKLGQVVTLGPAGRSDLPVNFPELLPHFQTGELVLVDDGAVSLRVISVTPPTVSLEVLNDGLIESRKGVNLPDTRLPIPALTAQDRELLAWGLQQDVDYVALSFVRRAADVRELKQLIADAGGDQLVVAKIEKKEALTAIDEIIAAADAVMVARGDLGVEIDAAEVPIWQKRIIHAALDAGRPVITATQMLQSMVAAPRPTRAEASDVANAIYDSSSAVMLSGETAVGAYPVEAVTTMAHIASTVEDDIANRGWRPQRWERIGTTVDDAISNAACEIARRINAAAIVTATFSGATARAVARYRPQQPIIGVSPNQRVVNQLALSWGVHALLGHKLASFEEVVSEANDLVLASGLARRGDIVVMTAGVQANQKGATNLIKAHVLG
ncbi:MAG: pyruvate kinase [Thermoleophilia bacterium]